MEETKTELKTKTCECGEIFIPRYRGGLLISKHCPECIWIAERLKRINAGTQSHRLNITPVKSPVIAIKQDGVKKKTGKRISEKGLIAKLDKAFSIFIRQRDSRDGVVFCISCGKPVKWKLSDNGHYLNRKHMSTRYDEVNCNAQCRSCNRFDEGNMSGYRKGLIKKYGEQEVDRLELKKFNTCHISSVELEIMIRLYTAKNKAFGKADPSDILEGNNF